MTSASKSAASLVASSLLGALLFTVHVTHDFIFGLDRMSRMETFTYLLIMVVWLYGTLELWGQRSGYVIMLLAGLLAAGMPVLHTAGGPQSAARGAPFVWTLLALGAAGAFSAVLSARELAKTFHRAS